MITELWEHTHLWRNDSRVPAQAIRHQRVSVIAAIALHFGRPVT